MRVDTSSRNCAHESFQGFLGEYKGRSIVYSRVQCREAARGHLEYDQEEWWELLRLEG